MAAKIKIPMLAWQRGYLADDSRFLLLAASRQSGKSYGIAARRVMKAVGKKRLGVILSRGERQSLEVIEKVKAHVKALGVACTYEDTFFKDTSLLQHTVVFPNESRIIGLPANPDTARGYSGDIDLDEFALHKDSREIWKAAYPTITRGYSICVASTFKGTNNKFYEIAKELELIGGERPEQQPVRAAGSVWSGHWVNIHVVAEQAPAIGLSIDPEELRRGLGDEDVWQEEYLNIPMEDGEAYIPLEMVLACESELASLMWDGRAKPGLCAGWDFARNRDRSVIVIGELVAGLLIVRGVIWLSRLPFAEQERVGRNVAQVIQASDGTFSMDAGGNGAQIAETLQKEFTCVDAVQFGSAVETGAKDENGAAIKELVKLRLARDAKRRFEENAWRLPDSREIRNAVTAVKRSVSPTGNIIIDAAHTDKGHADEFWALALLNGAAAGARRYVPASAGGLVGEPVMGGLMGRVF